MKLYILSIMVLLCSMALFLSAMDQQQEGNVSPEVKEIIKKRISISGGTNRDYSTEPGNEQHPSPEVRRHYSNLINSKGRSSSTSQLQ